MDGTFVDALAKESRRPRTADVGGKTHLITPAGDGSWKVEDLVGKIPVPEPQPLGLSTLQGVLDYLRDNRDGLGMLDSLLHVVNANLVELRSTLRGVFEQRICYLRAACSRSEFPFGGFLDSETFIVSLLALFEESDERARVLRILGTIKDEAVKTSTDDGVTQIVSARAGVVAVQDAPVTNPVRLAPFRTFREVEQPVSPFILRLRPGKDGSLPSCALFEADGGAWELEAIANIKGFLRDQVPGDLSIIA